MARGLGKGLGALLPSTPPDQIAAANSPLREVPLSSIVTNPYQPREHFDEDTLVALSSSIKEVGILQPLLVREKEAGKYELIAGERRMRAAQRAGLKEIPVIVREIDDQLSLVQAVIENLHRQDLNALEEAAAYRQLIDDFKITHDAVAKRVGKSRVAITNTLRLLGLPSGIQRQLIDGKISAGHARALLGTEDKAFQESLSKRISKEGLSVRATEEAVRMREGGKAIDLTDETIAKAKNGAKNRNRPPALLELEKLLGDYLNTRVGIEMGAKRGKISVEFSTLEDLERIYKAMTTDKTRR